jgi:hypothetical protein
VTVIGGERRCWGCSTVTNRPHLEVMHDGFDAVWCPICWHERRFGFAMVAMSRVMLWVRMELEAQRLFALFVACDHSVEFAGVVARTVAFADVVRGMAGRLRLTYPEES